MPTSYPGVTSNGFPPIEAPDDGEAANAASVKAGFQDAADRTRYLLDGSGVVFLGNKTFMGTVTVAGTLTAGTNLAVSGNLTVGGNTTIGNLGTDTCTINSDTTVSSSGKLTLSANKHVQVSSRLITRHHSGRIFDPDEAEGKIITDHTATATPTKIPIIKLLGTTVDVGIQIHMPHGCTWTTTNVFYAGNTLTGVTPSTMPAITIIKKHLGTGETEYVKNTLSGGQDIDGSSGFRDSVGSTAAYKAFHAVTPSTLNKLQTAEVIDNLNYEYFVIFTSSSTIDEYLFSVQTKGTITQLEE